MEGNSPHQQPSSGSSLGTAALPPRHIAHHHWAELVEGSSIAPAVAALNFRSFGEGYRDPERERQALLSEAFAQMAPDEAGLALRPPR
jgi:hypothetical protein